MKRLLFSLFALFLSVSMFAGTYDSGTSSFTSTSYDGTAFSFSCTKGDGSSAPAVYSGNIRLYRKSSSSAQLGSYITITPKSGYALTSVTITIASSLQYQYTLNGGTATTATATSLTVSDVTSSLKFQNYSKSQMNVTRIQVTYSGGCTDPEPLAIDGACNVNENFDLTTNCFTSSNPNAKVYTCTSDNKTSCTISGSTFTASAPGTYAIKVTQAANATYCAVDESFNVVASYTLTAESNNTTYGTVSLDGNVITGSPKSGYGYANPAYTVSPSGVAIVNRSGNTFTVSNQTANCTVTINFAEKGCTDHSGTNVTSGTSTAHTYGPVTSYYNYSTRQILYTKTDLDLAAGKKGTIKSIYFEYAYSTAMTKKTDVKIYMANTNLTALSKSSCVPFSSFTEVYSGALNCTNNGWNEFMLTTPFVYNGTGNLVVLIDDNSGQYDGSSYVFKYHTASTTSGAQIYNNADGTNVDPSTNAWSSFSETNYRPNTKFCIQEADMTQATVTWFVNGSSKHTQTDYPGTTCTSPTTPTTSDCDGSKVFVGWTASPIASSTDDAPDDLFTDPTSKTIPDGGANYYAVFATSSGGDVTKSFGWETASDADWTVSNSISRTEGTTTYPANSGSYYGLFNSNVSVQFNNKVNVKAFSYYCVRKTTNTNTSITIQTSTDGTSWTDALSTAWADFNSDGKTYKQIEKTWDGTTQYYVRLNIVTAANRMLDDVSITYSGTTYSGYVTTCSAATNTVYFTPTDAFKGDNWNHYAVYYWGGSTGWKSLTQEESCKPVYKTTELPANVTGMTFVSLNAAGNDWGNKISQTADITSIANNNYYTLTGNVSDSKYTVNTPTTYAAPTYSVTYKANGGTGDDIVVSGLACGATHTAKNADTYSRTNWTFWKWSDQDGNKYSAGEDISVNKDLTLYAHWEAWSVYGELETASSWQDYYLENGSKSVSMAANVTREFLVKYQKTDSDPVYYGWGQNTDKYKFTASGSKDLHANYNNVQIQTAAVAGTYTFSFDTETKYITVTYPTTYTVTFSNNGKSAATNMPADQTIVNGGKVTAPDSNPALAAHEFGGWYKESSCNNVWNFSSDVVTGATTIYAKWTPNLPSISVHPQSANYVQDATATALSVTASVTGGTVSFQWQVSNDGTSGWANVASEGTSQTYTPSTETVGTKYYRCVVTNATAGSGSTNSNAATIVVGYKTDHFIDLLQGTDGYTGDGKAVNTLFTKESITLDHKAQAAPTAECQAAHYHFVGWVTAATRESKKSQYADSDIVVFQATDNIPTGTTYYAVWAKEAQ